MQVRFSHVLTKFSIPIVLILLLAACGNGESNDPTPTPESEATIPLAPGQLSVGQLLDGIEASAVSIVSARTVFTTRSTDGTPTTTATTTEDYIAPDKRRIQTTNGSTVIDEQIRVGSAVYMRGSFVVTAVAPMLTSDTWVMVDPSLVPADTPVGNVVTYLMSSFQLPFATVSEEMRGRR